MSFRAELEAVLTRSCRKCKGRLWWWREYADSPDLCRKCERRD
jgi:hypothetical protein